MEHEDCKPVEKECPNCHEKIIVWQDANGVCKWVCKRCGTMTVSKNITRRHIQMDIYAPKGQVAI